MGKKYLLVESEGGGGSGRGGCVFKMCINELSNYLGGCREIFFSTYDQPAVGTMAGSQAHSPLKKRLNWQGLPPVMTRSPSTKIG